MKTGCRLLAAFLMMMVLAGALPLAAHAEDPGTFTELQQEIDQIPSGGSLKLAKPYKCEDGFSVDGIVIKNSITIDLNGHTIDGNGKARIFFVNDEVTLTLKGPGTIKGGVAVKGGGIYAGANAKLSLQNVEISGNHADAQGGGVFLGSGAQGLEIGGETIVSGNTCRASAGGTAADNVYLYGPQLTVTSPLTGKAKIGLSPDSNAISDFSRNETFDRMMPLGAGFNTNHPGDDIEAFFVSDDQSICIGNRALNNYDMFCSRHTHQMVCRPNPENEAELEYVCTAESCPMPSPFAKLTLVAENRVYNGQEYDDARLDDLAQFNQITGLGLALFDDNAHYLDYWGGEDTGFSFSPLFPGSYWAVFRPAEGTIKKNFEITPASLTIKPKTQTFTYNEAIQGPGDTAYAGSDVEAAVEVSGLAEDDYVASFTIDGQGKDAGTYELEITGLRIENSEGIDVTTCYAITYEKGSLVIGKKPLTLGLTMDGWIVGEAASTPVLTGNEGNGDVTYAYKPQGADKAAYSPDVPTAAGEYTVRATVEETKNHLGGEKTADFTIFPALTGISLDSRNAKTDYFTGEALDVNNLVLTAEYYDGSTKTITVTPEMVAGFDSQKPGRQTLTVTYAGFTAEYEVEIKAKPAPAPVTVTGIKLGSDNAKKEYTEGDTLNVSGLALTVSKSDGSTETVPVTKAMVSGFDGTKPGKQTLTVTYGGHTAEYEVEIKAKPAPAPVTVTGIKLGSNNAKKEYTEGDPLDVSDLKLRVTKSDGSEVTVDVTPEMISGFDNTKPGKQTLTVTYKGFTVTFEVEVKAKPAPKPDPKPTPEPESGSDDEPEPEPARAVFYSIRDSAGNEASSFTWHKGSVQPLTVIVSRSENDSLTYEQFYCLMIDGKTVDEGQYVASAGSLKLAIRPEFLETLRPGSHYTWIGFDDGSAAMNIEIAAAGTQPDAAAGTNPAAQAPGANAKSPADTPQARTGDSSNPALYGSIMLAALAMLAALLYSRRYSRR